MNWIKKYSSPPTIVSAILSEYIWFTARIKIDNKIVFNRFFSSTNINFVGQLFECNGTLKFWGKIKEEYSIPDKKNFFGYS